MTKNDIKDILIDLYDKLEDISAAAKEAKQAVIDSLYKAEEALLNGDYEEANTYTSYQSYNARKLAQASREKKTVTELIANLSRKLDAIEAKEKEFTYEVKAGKWRKF